MRQRPAVERVRPPKAPFWLMNRVMRTVLASPRRTRVGRYLLLLHLTGRRTGRRFVLPVGYRRLDDGRLLVLTNSGWRLNLRGRPNVEVTLLGELRPALAQLVEDPDMVGAVYRQLIDAEGYGKAGRRM